MDSGTKKGPLWLFSGLSLHLIRFYRFLFARTRRNAFFNHRNYVMVVPASDSALIFGIIFNKFIENSLCFLSIVYRCVVLCFGPVSWNAPYQCPFLLLFSRCCNNEGSSWLFHWLLCVLWDFNMWQCFDFLKFMSIKESCKLGIRELWYDWQYEVMVFVFLKEHRFYGRIKLGEVKVLCC